MLVAVGGKYCLCYHIFLIPEDFLLISIIFVSHCSSLRTAVWVHEDRSKDNGRVVGQSTQNNESKYPCYVQAGAILIDDGTKTFKYSIYFVYYI